MFAYRGWRQQWGDERKCGGALVWQLNDCWPVTSWAICDYYLRKKPAYYVMARVLAPLAIGVRRGLFSEVVELLWMFIDLTQPTMTGLSYTQDRLSPATMRCGL